MVFLFQHISVFCKKNVNQIFAALRLRKNGKNFMQITGIIPIAFHVSQNKSSNSINFFLIDQVIIVQTEGPFIYPPFVLSVKNYLWDDRIVQKTL